MSIQTAADGSKHWAKMRPEKPKVYDRLSDDLGLKIEAAHDLVDDPLEAGAKLKVVRNVRHDPIGRMWSRNEIDQAQYAAGRKWQEYYEAAEIVGSQAIDTTKEAVDGGRFPEPFVDRRRKALLKLAAAHKELQDYGWSIVFDVLGRNMHLADIARARMFTERQQQALGPFFHECLEKMAKRWGLA